MNTWTALLAQSRTVFHAPSFAIFTDLLTGWVCAPGRRTITTMITVADPVGAREHDAYHRFIRDGVWNMSALWRTLATHAVDRFAPAGVIELLADDTLHHKTGRHVNGAGVFRGAVRSTAHAADMITELARWLPGRDLHLCADGAYATLAGTNLANTELTSRMRRDAALFEPAPPRTGKRGRPNNEHSNCSPPPSH